MKRIVLITTIMLLLPCCCLAQFLRVFNVDVPLYKDATTLTPFYFIQNDTVAENYPDLEIIEESPLRFKVKVLEYEDHVYDEVSAITHGWIDKLYCGIYISNILKGGIPYVRLYREPCRTADSELIIQEFEPVILLEKPTPYEPFIKVMFWNKETECLYIGYALGYSGNIYDPSI